MVKVGAKETHIAVLERVIELISPFATCKSIVCDVANPQKAAFQVEMRDFDQRMIKSEVNASNTDEGVIITMGNRSFPVQSAGELKQLYPFTDRKVFLDCFREPTYEDRASAFAR